MRRLFRRGRLDAERAREMQAHIDHHTDDLVAAGHSRQCARQEARHRFGNPAVSREEIYQMNSVPILEPLIRDLRYAGRMLRKTPGFTVIALATLAIGIGVNTAVFTVVNTLLLKPLPYPDPARLATVSVLIRSPRGVNENTSVDGATFLAVRGVAATVDTAVWAGGFNLGVNLVAQGVAANVKQGRVSAGYFSVLGVRPFMGREFTAEEDRIGGPPVAVLSHGLWTRVFGANPSILGQPIELKGEPYTVVGVMPEGFTTGSSYDVWTPVRPSETGEGGGSNYGMIVRLRPGVSWQQATAEVDRLGGSKLLQQYQNAKNKNELTASAKLVPLQESATQSIRQPLVMLWGAVGVVLLIACVNIAGLLLARSALRRREIATRLALGSSRVVVIRQLLVESAVLALAGGLLGLGVGEAVLSLLLRLSTDVFPVGYPIALDGRVLTLTLLLALTTSVLFGLVPALHATRVDVQRALQESGSRAVAGGSGRWRRVLVAGEIALSVILLTGAGLLVRTFVQLRSLEPGFDPTNVTTASVSLQDKRYDDATKANRLFADTLAEIRRQPGVVAAGISLGLPYTRLLNLGWARVEGATEDDKGGGANVSYITPGYFEALRVPVRTGRLFGDADTEGSLPVAIVNDAFVRRFYREQSVVGLHIAVAGAQRQIVGVVGNTRTRPSGMGGDGSALPTPYIIYIPAAQTPTRTFTLVHTWFSPAWVVQSAGVAGIHDAIRQAVAKVDPLLPIAKIESMSDVQGAALASQRFMMTLVLGLGVVALLLAGIGIHGLIASSVTERTRELGVRLALGASSGQVMKDVVTPGLTLAAVGVAIGAAGALASARLMQAFIWGVQARDPLTLLAVIATLLVVALVASVIPALRVLRLDPARTLRAE